MLLGLGTGPMKKGDNGSHLISHREHTRLQLQEVIFDVHDLTPDGDVDGCSQVADFRGNIVLQEVDDVGVVLEYLALAGESVFVVFGHVSDG